MINKTSGKKRHAPSVLNDEAYLEYLSNNNNNNSSKPNNTVKQTKSQDIKKRNWAFVVYPDSAPKDWEDILQKTGLQCAISPLHDKDVDPTEKPKKAHWHVIVAYSGPTSYNVVKKLCDSLKAPIPQALEQIRGYYRYLTHKDNPEKHQYSEKDIKFLNGFNIANFIELTKGEITEIKRILQKLIISENIVEYSALMDHLLEGDVNHYDVACNNTFFFDKYITSRRHKTETVKVDKETGEILK